MNDFGYQAKGNGDYCSDVAQQGRASFASQGAVLGGGETKRRSEMDRYVADLEKAIAMCLGDAEQLEAALGSVLRIDQPSPTGNGACEAAAPPQTGMGERLNAIGGRAMSVHSRLQGLLRRLEV